MYCYFSASHSQPPILLTSLYLAVLQTLLKKLCELSLSETPDFFLFFLQMLIKFYIACTAIFKTVAASPQSLVTSLHLAALLKKLCELSPSKTFVCVFFCY